MKVVAASSHRREEPTDERLEEAEIIQLSDSDLDSGDDEGAVAQQHARDSDSDDSDSDGSSVSGDVVIINAVDEPEVDDAKISSMRASIRDKLKAKAAGGAGSEAIPSGAQVVPFSTDLLPKGRRGLHSDEEAESEDDAPVAKGKGKAGARRGYVSSDDGGDDSDDDDDSEEDSEPEQLVMPVFRRKVCARCCAGQCIAGCVLCLPRLTLWSGCSVMQDERNTIIELERQQAEEERKEEERLKAVRGGGVWLGMLCSCTH